MTRPNMTRQEELKKQAALRAVAHVQSGMRVGLGTGSTAKYAIEAIGQRLANGDLQDITAVPTSEASAQLARALGIPLVELDERGVDVAIDGMDEVTPTLDAIKGLGGALTREKIVAARAKCFILIGDASKQGNRLGENAPIPVEVLPFGWQAAKADLQRLGCEVTPRRNGPGENAPLFVSDNGNYVLDCHCKDGFKPHDLAAKLQAIPGVVEHGLFLGLAHLAYVATPGGVLELTP